MKKFEKLVSAVTPCVQKVLAWSQAVPALSRRTVVLGMILCLGLAFGLRCLRFQVEPVLSRDGAGYVMNAEKMQQEATTAQNVGFSPHYFYPAFLASKLFGLSPHALGVRTNILLGSLLPLLFFLIARILFRNDEVALWCALLGAVQPKLVAYSIEVQREIPYLFFFCVFTIFAVLFYRSRKWYWNIGMALGATLGFCFRYEGFELFGIALVVYGICCVVDRKQVWKYLRDLGIFGVSSIGFFISYFAWLGVSFLSIWENTLRRLPF